jgi:hypothetical protein
VGSVQLKKMSLHVLWLAAQLKKVWQDAGAPEQAEQSHFPEQPRVLVVSQAAWQASPPPHPVVREAAPPPPRATTTSAAAEQHDIARPKARTPLR